MRTAKLEVAGQAYEVELTDPASLAIALDFDGDQPGAFGLPSATAEPITFDSVPCDTRKGGDFNADVLHLVPHGNGTHTETVGHLVDEEVSIGESLTEGFLPCTLLSAETTRLNVVDEQYSDAADPDDIIVPRRSVSESLAELEPPRGFECATVIRTRRDTPAESLRDYSDTNPAYPTADLVEWAVDRGTEHLLVDLPSLDREREGGSLVNHRTFWGLDLGVHTQTPATPRTVTELVHVPPALPDGIYLLDLQVPPFATDAAPSRPLLYDLAPVD